MRHLKRTAKLGRTGTHRNSMLANMVCSLIKHKRIQTTLAKAKAAQSVAEKIVTLLEGAPTQRQQIHLALTLPYLNTGWDFDQIPLVGRAVLTDQHHRCEPFRIEHQRHDADRAG